MVGDLRKWGMAIVAVALGMGCSTSPLVPGGLGEGGGGTVALADVGNGPIAQALTHADAYFITQYHNVRYNPDQTRASNANCGPTSLAMALKAFDREPATLATPTHAHDLIVYVRKLMTGTTDESTWTYPIQVRDGARAVGLNSEMVFTLNAIETTMAHPGHLCVVNVNPSPAYADQLAFPYDGGHFALVTAINGDRVSLNDPLAGGPIQISLDQLQMALTTPLGNDPNGHFVPPFDGGIAVWE